MQPIGVDREFFAREGMTLAYSTWRNWFVSNPYFPLNSERAELVMWTLLLILCPIMFVVSVWSALHSIKKLAAIFLHLVIFLCAWFIFICFFLMTVQNLDRLYTIKVE